MSKNLAYNDDSFDTILSSFGVLQWRSSNCLPPFMALWSFDIIKYDRQNERVTLSSSRFLTLFHSYSMFIFDRATNTS